MDTSREILQFLHYHPLSSRGEIARATAFDGSDAMTNMTMCSKSSDMLGRSRFY
jgi:hypothetical protein